MKKMGQRNTNHLSIHITMKEKTRWNKWNDTSREVHEMFKTTAIDTLKQDKKCQAYWYIIL